MFRHIKAQSVKSSKLVVKSICNPANVLVFQGFFGIIKIFMYKNDDGLEHTLGWSEEILAFYENALKENCQVIFTVDF